MNWETAQSLWDKTNGFSQWSEPLSRCTSHADSTSPTHNGGGIRDLISQPFGLWHKTLMSICWYRQIIALSMYTISSIDTIIAAATQLIDESSDKVSRVKINSWQDSPRQVNKRLQNGARLALLSGQGELQDANFCQIVEDDKRGNVARIQRGGV